MTNFASIHTQSLQSKNCQMSFRTVERERRAESLPIVSLEGVNQIISHTVTPTNCLLICQFLSFQFFRLPSQPASHSLLDMSNRCHFSHNKVSLLLALEAVGWWDYFSTGGWALFSRLWRHCLKMEYCDSRKVFLLKLVYYRSQY